MRVSSGFFIDGMLDGVTSIILLSRASVSWGNIIV